MDRAATPPTLAQRLRGIAVDSVKQWVDDRGASKGAALAYYTLFSLAPVLIIVLAIAGVVFGEDAARGAIFHELRGLVGQDGAQAIQLLLAHARDPKTGIIATVIALGLLLVGATTVFGELKESLDEIWRVPKSHKPGVMQFIRTRLLSFSVILVLAFLLLVSLAVNAALSLLEQYLGGFWADAAWILQPLSSLVSFAVIAALFGAIYKLLPRVKLSWHDVTIGALGTAIMFTVGKFAIGLYIGNSGTTSSFGAAGSLIALLLWVYYSAQIFFLGAEFARQYALQMGSLKDKHVPGAPPPEARPSPVH